MNIRTTYIYPPIPQRDMDWMALDDDSYDGAPDAGRLAHVVGFGASESEAIEDLLEQLAEYAEVSA